MPSHRRKSIQISPLNNPSDPDSQTARIRLIVPEEVVMQSRFTVAILVLQVEGLVSSSGYVSFILQYVPTVIIAELNQISFIIGHLSRDADLVAVEVVGLLDAFTFFVGPVVYMCVSHMPYVRIGRFMRATTYLFIFISITIALKRRI